MRNWLVISRRPRIRLFVALGLAAALSIGGVPAVSAAVDGDEDVAALQRSLNGLGYFAGSVDGDYGPLTRQAIYAFEKSHGKAVTGRPSAALLAQVRAADRPAPRVFRSGDGIEINETRQLVTVVHDGVAVMTLHTSTGSEQWYTIDGDRRLAYTPNGRYEIYREIDGMRHAQLGDMWRPKYFNGGVALHGSDSIPTQPASHGCVRVSNAAMDMIWERHYAPVGTAVAVFGDF